MNTPLLDTSAYAIELDEGQSRRLLAHAIKRKAGISILPHTRTDGLPVQGTLIGETVEGLLVRSPPVEVTAAPELVSVYGEATIHLEGARFLFSTNIMGAWQEDDGLRAEIAKPAQLHLIQRRRHPRRDLRSPTPVRIIPADPEGTAPGEATLLNIGTGGLACRLDRAAAEPCRIGRMVRLEFTLADFPDTFHLPAYVRGRTPGASPGQIILSLEFAPGAETATQRERLAEALQDRLTALSGG